MPEPSSSVTEICDKLFLQPAMSQSDLPLGRGLMGCVLAKIRTVLMYKKVKANLVLLQCCPLNIFSWKGSKPLSPSSLVCYVTVINQQTAILRWGQNVPVLRKRWSTHRWVEDGSRFCMGILDKVDSRTYVSLMKEVISCRSLWSVLLCHVTLWNIPQGKGQGRT